MNHECLLLIPLKKSWHYPNERKQLARQGENYDLRPTTRQPLDSGQLNLAPPGLFQQNLLSKYDPAFPGLLELFHDYQTGHDAASSPCAENLMKEQISGTHLDKYQWDLVTRPRMGV